MAEQTGCNYGRGEAQRQPGSCVSLARVGAALTGVAGSRALLRPVTAGSEGQRPRVRIRGVGPGVHVPFQNQPTGL